MNENHKPASGQRRAVLASMLVAGAAAVAPSALAQPAASTGSGQPWPAKPILPASCRSARPATAARRTWPRKC